MAAIALLLWSAAPEPALAWDVGNSATYIVTYDSNEDGNPESTETWIQTVAGTETVAGIDCYKTTASFSPTPSRTICTGNGCSSTGGATITSSTTWRAVGEARVIKQVSQQKVLGFVNNTDTVQYKYFGYPGYPSAVGQSWSYSATTNMVNPFVSVTYNDRFSVSVTGTETISVGSANVPCFKVEHTLTSSTNPYLPSGKVGTVVFTEWWPQQAGLTLGPVKQVDSYHFVGTETQVMTAHDPALPSPPTVSTGTASSVGTATATLNGTLSDLGSASTVQVYFEYGLDTNYSSGTTPYQAMSGTGPFTARVTGLVPNTTYHFRAVAVGDGTSYGGDVSFTTAPIPVAPAVSTGSASGVGAYGATLNGTLSDLGSASTVQVYFEYGLDTSYSLGTTPYQEMAALGTFAAQLTGLTPGTTYHFRAVAVGDGTAYGDDMVFTTLAPAPPVPPVPEITSIVLVSVGLMILGGLVISQRRRMPTT